MAKGGATSERVDSARLSRWAKIKTTTVNSSDWKPRTLGTGGDSSFRISLEVAADDCIHLVRTGSGLRSFTGKYHSFENHSRFLHHPFRTCVVGTTASLYPS